MLAPKDLQSIANTCVAISNEVAGPSGFVPVRSLLQRFDVSLIIRPLLVEGMLASMPAAAGFSRNKLTVLIDSETFKVDDKEVALEEEGNPLPPRFRNTVAHELVHSLAFRPAQFGMRLEQAVDSEDKVTQFVKEVERETERLSPLLLWPERYLERLLVTREKPVTPGELATIAAKLGVSRQVALTRLRLRRARDGIIYSPWLRDVAIGIGIWGEGRRALLRKWPLFVNFDRNIAPDLLQRIAAQDRIPALAVFPDESFVLGGGQYTQMQFMVPAGLADAPSIQIMPSIVSVETGNNQPGSEFFFVIRKKRPDDQQVIEDPAESE